MSANTLLPHNYDSNEHNLKYNPIVYETVHDAISVTSLLNEWKLKGHDLTKAFIQISPLPTHGFIIFHEAELDRIKE